MSEVHTDAQADDGHAATDGMTNAIIVVPRVFHIGTLDPSDLGRNSGAGSYEGRCLSVSVCPNAWRQIAKLGGYPLWEMTRTGGGRFLDVHVVQSDPDLMAEIKAWAIDKGYLEDVERWTAWCYDEELESTITMLCDTLDEALDEADIETEDDSSEEAGVRLDVVSKATPLLAAVVAVKPESFEAEGAAADDFAIMAWCTEEALHQGLDLDGVWWRERLDPDVYSAPRGAVFPERVTAWNTTSIDFDDVEDDDEVEFFEDLADGMAWRTMGQSSTAPDDLREQYSHGECHVLAVAMHRQFGWPIHVVLDAAELYWEDPDDPDNVIPSVVHCYAVDPDGNAWDIHGVRPESSIRREASMTYAIGDYDSHLVETEEELATYVGCWVAKADPNDDDEPEPDPIDRPLHEYTDDDVEEAWTAAEQYLGHITGWPMAEPVNDIVPA